MQTRAAVTRIGRRTLLGCAFVTTACTPLDGVPAELAAAAAPATEPTAQTSAPPPEPVAAPPSDARFRAVDSLAWAPSGDHLVWREDLWDGPWFGSNLVATRLCRAQADALEQRTCTEVLVDPAVWWIVEQGGREVVTLHKRIAGTRLARWDLEEGRELARREAVDLRDVAPHEDGTLLVLSAVDNRLALELAATENLMPLRTIPLGISYQHSQLAPLPSIERVAVLDTDGALWLVDVTTGKVQTIPRPRPLDYVLDIVASPSGSDVAILWLDAGEAGVRTLAVHAMPSARLRWRREGLYDRLGFEGGELRVRSQLDTSGELPETSELHAFDRRGRPRRVGAAAEVCQGPRAIAPDGTRVASVVDHRVVVGPVATAPCGSSGARPPA